MGLKNNIPFSMPNKNNNIVVNYWFICWKSFKIIYIYFSLFFLLLWMCNHPHELRDSVSPVCMICTVLTPRTIQSTSGDVRGSWISVLSPQLTNQESWLLLFKEQIAKIAKTIWRCEHFFWFWHFIGFCLGEPAAYCA